MKLRFLVIYCPFWSHSVPYKTVKPFPQHSSHCDCSFCPHNAQKNVSRIALNIQLELIMCNTSPFTVELQWVSGLGCNGRVGVDEKTDGQIWSSVLRCTRGDIFTHVGSFLSWGPSEWCHILSRTTAIVLPRKWTSRGPPGLVSGGQSVQCALWYFCSTGSVIMKTHQHDEYECNTVWLLYVHTSRDRHLVVSRVVYFMNFTQKLGSVLRRWCSVVWSQFNPTKALYHSRKFANILIFFLFSISKCFVISDFEADVAPAPFSPHWCFWLGERRCQR